MSAFSAREGLYSASMLSTRHATLDDTTALGELLARCAVVDGHAPLSEFKALRVPVANGARSIVAEDAAGDVVGVVVAAWHPTDIGETDGYWAAEMALDPARRSEAAYLALLGAIEADLGRTPALWTFAAEQSAVARHRGLTKSRTLVEMRRPLPAPAPQLPEELRVRSFVAGADEKAWLALNSLVFAHHPEAGSIDAADLALRMAQPWFDAAGLLMLFDGASPVGYCWTKSHPGSVGEIYMIGLVASHRGRGLARSLTLVGLEYLAGQGAKIGMLYAEASNTVATGLYESLEFEIVRRITLYQSEKVGA